MPRQLIPDPDLAPPIPAGLTPEQRIALWVDLMNTCDQFLLAGLRHAVGPEGDLVAAYREWYARHMEDHDRAMCRMVDEFNRRIEGHGR